ncbi:unnamed protein product [marine sediment metagenome]|uniref:Uncharacterized protein n=1 Tax=marine sediment metagenome TaxID=412755 RepID=X1IQJ2_9ZZZZ
MLEEKPAVPNDKLDKLLLDGDMINYPSGDEVFFDVIAGETSRQNQGPPERAKQKGAQ